MRRHWLLCRLDQRRPVGAATQDGHRVREVSRARGGLSVWLRRVRSGFTFHLCIQKYGKLTRHLRQCAFTLTDVEECGGCVGLGGRDCTKINNALSSSCREGTCVIRKPCIIPFELELDADSAASDSCESGFLPKGDRSACEEVFEDEDE